MTKFLYNHFVDAASESLAIRFGEGENLQVKQILDSHPNFSKVRALVLDPENTATDEDVLNLIDFGLAVGQKLQKLSDRIVFDGSNIFFDGDVLRNTLTEHILRMLDEDNPKLTSLVAFLENVAQNMSANSIDSIYNWLNNREFTITRDGQIIAYKGVQIGPNGESLSRTAGFGIVNGVTHNGYLPNPEGAVVEIPRSKVDADNAVGCSTGLHAGTWKYAHAFARGRTLKVQIHPRDIVSVPEDAQFQKLRVCRYVVLEETDAPETLPVVGDYASEWTEEELEEWSDAGFEQSEADSYMESGYSLHEALVAEGVEEEEEDDYYDEDEDDEPRDELDEWFDAGFGESDIEHYKDALGYTVNEALSAMNGTDKGETNKWEAQDFDGEEIHHYRDELSLSLEEAIEARNEERNATAERLAPLVKESATAVRLAPLVTESFVSFFAADGSAPVTEKKSKKKKKNKKNKN
jgi:hypothetical protein